MDLIDGAELISTSDDKQEIEDNESIKKPDPRSTTSTYGLSGVFSMYSKLVPIATFTSQDGATESWKQKYDNLAFSHAQEIHGMQKDMAEMAKNVHGEISALQERSATFEHLVTKLNETVEQQTQKIASLQQQLSSSLAVCHQQEKTIVSLQEEADKYRQLANAGHELARVRSDMALAESKEQQNLRQDLSQSDALVRELRVDLQRLSQNFNQTIQSQNKSEAEWSSKLSVAETEADRLRKSLDKAQQRYNSDVSRLQAEIDRAQHQRTDLMSTLDQVERQEKTSASQLKQSRALTLTLQHKLQQADAALVINQTECRQLQSQLDRAKDDLSRSRSDCEVIRQTYEEQRIALAQAQKHAQDGVREIETLRAEQIRIAQEKAAVIDEREKIQGRLKTELDKCQQLSRENEEIVSLRDRQAAQLRRHQAQCIELENKLANAMKIIGRDQDTMAIAKMSIERLGSTQSIQQEQNELVTRELKAKTEEINELKAVIGRHTEQMQALTVTKTELERANAELRKRAEQDGQRVRQIEEGCERQRAENRSLLERLGQLNETYEQHQKQTKTDQQQIRSLTCTIQQLEHDMKAVIALHTEQMQALSATKAELESINAGLRKRAEEDGQRIRQIEIEQNLQLRQFQETLQQERDDNEQYQKQICSLTGTIQQLERNLKAADQERERLQLEMRQAARDAWDQDTVLRQSQLEAAEQNQVVGELLGALEEANIAITKLQIEYENAVSKHDQRCRLESDRFRLIEDESDDLRLRLNLSEGEGDKLRTAGRDAAAQIEALNKELQHHHQQITKQIAVIDELRATLQARDAAFTELQGECERSAEQLAAALKVADDRGVALHAKEQESRTRNRYKKMLQKKIGRHKADSRAVQAQLLRQQDETKTLQKANESWSAELAMTKTDLRSLQARHRRQSDQVLEMNAAILAKVDGEKRASDEIARLGVELKETKEEIDMLRASRNEINREVERWKADAERLREQIVAMKLEKEKAIGSLRKVSNGIDAFQDIDVIPVDTTPEDQIVRLSLQLHQADQDKKELNDRIVELNQEAKDLRRRIGSKSAMFESVLKTQLEKAIKFAAPDAQVTTRSRAPLNRQSSMRTLTAWEAAQRDDTISINDNMNMSGLQRHHRHQSMGGASLSKQPWKI